MDSCRLRGDCVHESNNARGLGIMEVITESWKLLLSKSMLTGAGDCSLNSRTMRPPRRSRTSKVWCHESITVARIAGPRDRRGGIQLPALAHWRVVAKDRDLQRGEADALKVDCLRARGGLPDAAGTLAPPLYSRAHHEAGRLSCCGAT